MKRTPLAHGSGNNREPVEATEVVDRLVHCEISLARLADITGYGQGLEFVGQAAHWIRAPCHQCEPASVHREGPCHRGTDTCAGADDQYATVAEMQIHEGGSVDTREERIVHAT